MDFPLASDAHHNISFNHVRKKRAEAFNLIAVLPLWWGERLSMHTLNRFAHPEVEQAAYCFSQLIAFLVVICPSASWLWQRREWELLKKKICDRLLNVIPVSLAVVIMKLLLDSELAGDLKADFKPTALSFQVVDLMSGWRWSRSVGAHVDFFQSVTFASS